jgi:hypothetical protein
MLAGRGVTCLLAGHTVRPEVAPAVLGSVALDVLKAHGLLDILGPYFDRNDASAAISPEIYENVIKHHCVADINVIVYDEVVIADCRAAPSGVEAVMTHGRSRWEVHASELVDGADLPAALPDAIVTAADLVERLLRAG